MKFEDSLARKVDMTKVRIDILKPWIKKRLKEVILHDYDVVVQFIFNQLAVKVSV